MIIPVTAIKEQLSNSKNLIITSHKNPDGDAVGSAMGLFHVLKNEGFEVHVILPDRFPDFLKWMPATEGIIYYDTDASSAQQLIDKADLIFCLDYNDLSRIGDLGSPLANFSKTKILVDHHPNPSNEFQISYSDTTASSTSQMVVELVNALNYESGIDQSAAACLYSGILTDTGSFRFSSTSSKTHLIAAQLIDTGIEGSEIHAKIFDNNSESRLKLTGYALSDKMIVLRNLKTAYFVLTAEELKRYNYRKGDTEGLVNYGLSIEGICIAVLFVEHENDVRISFRSFGNVPINSLAKQYFNGGGHLNAAGGRSTEPLDKVVAKFNEVLPKFVEEHAQ